MRWCHRHVGWWVEVALRIPRHGRGIRVCVRTKVGASGRCVRCSGRRRRLLELVLGFSV